jgi:hypothetical protein
MSSMVTWLWAPHARSIASTLAHFKLCCVVSCCLLCCHQLQRPCRISNAWQGSSGQVPENWQKEHLWRSELCKRTIVLQKIYLSSRKKKKTLDSRVALIAFPPWAKRSTIHWRPPKNGVALIHHPRQLHIHEYNIQNVIILDYTVVDPVECKHHTMGLP